MNIQKILEATRAAYKVESEELLTELDDALLALEGNPEDSAHINRVFRAMHTLKGSGATAGFKDLADYLHAVEDVFNAAREGKFTADSGLVDLALKVTDVVRGYFEKNGEAATAHLDAQRGLIIELRKYLPAEDGVVHKPGAAGKAAGSPGQAIPKRTGWQVWRIDFRPQRALFYSGNDIAAIFDELALLGTLIARCDHAQLPPLAELNAEECFLAWELQLLSKAEAGVIKEAFMFVEDVCALTVTEATAEQVWMFPNREIFPGESFIGFNEESEEHLTTVDAVLLALEAKPEDKELTNQLFRSLHNLKGIARLLMSEALIPLSPRHPLLWINSVTHAVETLVDSHREAAGAAFVAAELQLLFEATDGLRSLVIDFMQSMAATEPSLALQRGLKIGALAEPVVKESKDVRQAQGPAAGVELFVQAAQQCSGIVEAALLRSEQDSVTVAELSIAERALETLGKAAVYHRVGNVSTQTAELLARLQQAKASGVEPLPLAHVMELRESYALLKALLVGPMYVPQAGDGRETGSGMGAGEGLGLAGALGTALVEPSAAGAGAGGAAPGAASAAGGSAAAKVEPKSIRVDQEKLDRLMRNVGELLIARNAFPLLAKRLVQEYKLGALSKELKDAGDQVSRIARDLQDSVMAIRMLPVKTVFQRFPRMARDMARTLGKEINLILEGEETELDKTVIEQIGDPLVHLVRNAIDHGIEKPEDREEAGKPAQGTVRLRAYNQGGHVVIEITDDGKGMDPVKLRQKGIEKGLITTAQAAAMSDAAAIELIFLPGFSMAAKVTDVSGRGVGMDVVRNNIRQLQGTVNIESKLGAGSRFTITLPTSLMVSKGILVECEKEEYIFPVENVVEMVKLKPADIRSHENLLFTTIRGYVYTLIYFAEQLHGLAGRTPFIETLAKREEVCVAILQTREMRIAVAVDRFISEVEVIVKPLGDELGKIPCFQGATIMGDGKVVLAVNPEGLLVAA